MHAVVRRWGNSLGIRIPQGIAEELSLEDGSDVDLRNDGERLVVTPTGRESLEDLLSRVEPANLHGEVDSGPPLGKEAW